MTDREMKRASKYGESQLYLLKLWNIF